MPLRACPSCARHVRDVEASCPFCSSDLPPDVSAPVFAPRSRAALFAAAFAVVATPIACGSDSDPQPTCADPCSSGGVSGTAGAAGGGAGNGGAGNAGESGQGGAAATAGKGDAGMAGVGKAGAYGGPPATWGALA